MKVEIFVKKGSRSLTALGNRKILDLENIRSMNDGVVVATPNYGGDLSIAKVGREKRICRNR